MIKVDVKNNIKFPSSLVLKEDLQHIADKIFIPEIKQNMDREQSIRGHSYPKLAESTIKQKDRLGLSGRILRATGQLRNSFKSTAIGKSSIKISLSGNRREVGDILQNQGVRTKNGKRFFEFFGINPQMEILAIKYMKNKIKEKFRKK